MGIVRAMSVGGLICALGCSGEGGASTTTSAATEGTSGGSSAGTSAAASTSGGGSSGETEETGATSAASPCGDGALDAGEECDDGNAVDGDGCNSDCKPSGRRLWSVPVDAEGGATVTALASSPSGRLFAGGAVGSGTTVDAWLAEVAPADGALLWSKTIDLGSRERVYGLAVVGDELIAVGASSAADHDVLLLGASLVGEVRWQRVEAGEGDDYGTAVARVEGGAVAAGIMTRAEGVMTWAQRIEVGGAAAWTVERPTHSVAIFPLGPGIAGLSDRAVVGNRLKTDAVHEHLIGLGAAGAELWTRTIEDATGTVLGGGTTQGGSVLTAGQVVPEGFMVRSFGADGSLEWSSAACAGLSGRGVAGAPDGAVAAVGLRQGQGVDAVVCKVSAEGMLLWEQVVDGGGGDDAGLAVVALGDGVVVAAGSLATAGGDRGWIAAYAP